MCEMFPDVSKLSKVCDKCRKELSSLKNKQENNDNISDSSVTNYEQDDPNFFASSSVVLETLNTSLQELGESPIDGKKMKLKQYSTKKIKNIECAIKRQLFVNAEDSSDIDERSELEESCLANLKTNFSNAESRKKKVMLLTCLPESWSVRKIVREFNAPNYMVRQAKKLLKEKGILESPDQKPGKSLSKEVVQAVHSFYESDDISRVMPGKKDCVTIKGENGDKSVVSKTCLLYTSRCV